MATTAEIQRLFEQYGVPVASRTETPEQRLARIVQEVNSGTRDLSGVERSIQGIAQREGWTPNPYLSQIRDIESRLAQVTGPTPETAPRFDPVAAASYRGLDRQLADLQTNVQSQLGDLSTDRLRAVTDQERQREAALRALEARMADQGILRSGINVGVQGEIQDESLRNLESIQDLYSRGVRNAELQRTSGQNAITSQRELVQAGAAEAAAQQRLQEENSRARTASQLQGTLQQLQTMGAPTRSGINAPNDLTSRIRSMFQTSGVPIATGTESESQRLSRIAQEIQGGRTLEHLQGSLNNILATQPQLRQQQQFGSTRGLIPTFGTYRPYG